MKVLKISCFCLGLANLLLLLLSVETTPSLVEGGHGSHLSFAIPMVNAVIAARLAYLLNRSWFGWGFLTLFFGFILGLILPFLGESEEDHNYGGSHYSGSTSSYSGSSSYSNYFLSDKSCGKCGASVSLSSTAGQHCPRCGAYWGGERTIYK